MGMEPVPVHRRLLNGWMAIVARFGFVQTLVILSIFYALLIGPVALVGVLARRDLLDKRTLREAAAPPGLKADSARPPTSIARSR